MHRVTTQVSDLSDCVVRQDFVVAMKSSMLLNYVSLTDFRRETQREPAASQCICKVSLVISGSFGYCGRDAVKLLAA